MGVMVYVLELASLLHFYKSRTKTTCTYLLKTLHSMIASKSMYKKTSLFTLTFLTILFFQNAQAQTDSSTERPRIAVLAPLYLDSAFDNNNYKLGNLNIPRDFLPGLEFY